MDKYHWFEKSGPATFDAVGWNAHQRAYRRNPVVELAKGLGWLVFVVSLTLSCGTIAYLLFEALPAFGM